MVRIIESWLVLGVLVSAAAAQTFPKPAGRINDFAGVLDPAAEQQLDTLLDTLEKDTTSEIAVVTVESLDQIPVEEYANKLFNEWGVGQRGKDNGVLVLVAPAVREMRIAPAGPRTTELPAWGLVAFLAVFVAAGAYIIGIGVGAKTITFIVGGLAVAGFPGISRF